MTPATPRPYVANRSGIYSELASNNSSHAPALAGSYLLNLLLCEFGAGMGLATNSRSVANFMSHVFTPAHPFKVVSTWVAAIAVKVSKFSMQNVFSCHKGNANQAVHRFRRSLTLLAQHNDQIVVTVRDLRDRPRWGEVQRSYVPKVGDFVKSLVIRAGQPSFQHLDYLDDLALPCYNYRAGVTGTGTTEGNSAGAKHIAHPSSEQSS